MASRGRRRAAAGFDEPAAASRRQDAEPAGRHGARRVERQDTQRTGSQGAGRAGIWWCAAVIVLAGILSYSNSLSGPPLADDHPSLLENQHIRTLQPSSVLFPERENPLAGRPLVNLSFAVNYAIGGLDVRGYHVWNLAVHLLCGLVAFGLVRRTLDQPRIADGVRRRSIDVAFAAALLWVVHPLNTEAVDYLTQRTD